MEAGDTIINSSSQQAQLNPNKIYSESTLKEKVYRYNTHLAE
jgi:hypothetical protein